MRIALATCRNLPEWEHDDDPLREAFASRGVTVDDVCWDDDVEWGRFDGCLIRTTWDYTERREEFVSWARRVEQETTLLNPSRVVAWNTDKHYLQEVEAHGLRTIPTFWVEPGDTVDLATEMKVRGWSRGLIKPAVGATSHETFRFDADDEQECAASGHLAALQEKGGVLVQPYLERVETRGETSAIFVEGEMTHGVRKVPVPGDYRVQDDYGARDEPVAIAEEQVRVARNAMALCGEDLLYGRVDFLQDDGGEFCITELELVEPSMFFRHAPDAAERLAAAFIGRLGIS